MNPKVSEESPSSSRQDNNANLNNGVNQSKGAIPKAKYNLKNPHARKKNIKVNNNIEDISSLNIGDSTNILKLNGFSKTLTNDFVHNSVEIEDYEGTELSLSTTMQDNVENGSVSSSSEDNELSVSDDGCIYTYKGDRVADLPDSFYNIELPILDNNEVADEQRQGNSSPEMDFLEMDFDPGPSGDADSESSSSSQVDQACELPFDTNEKVEDQEPCCSKNIEVVKLSEISKEPSKILQSLSSSKNEIKDCKTKSCLKSVQKELVMPWSCTLWQRTRASKQLRVVKKHMNSFGELSSPKEGTTPTSDYKSSDCCDSVCEDENEKIMIWSDREASLKQITQISPSSCGATAVLNVLVALRLPIPSIDKIHEFVQTKLRANFSPLCEYLQSRSTAGCSHREIISGLKNASNGRIYARFFSMYPERCVNIYKWLGFWIQHGAVPVATLNLQKCDGSIPDSWHHQMIFGVDSTNVYLTNPLECVNSSVLWHQLVSESVLLIRRQDVVSRWNPRVDLEELGKIKDNRWRDLNVLGQVAKVIREQPRSCRENASITSHIKIPADYKSGITLAIDINSSAYPLLRECPELPLLNISNTAVIS
ncbi:hypothetical protein HHI36_003070 [Cryptolaemus montrouzieri]|uniref:Uncharacterized protein n=1 Tax=Cryptolaemus montrouzieri TaxID=559131 RepID=A0ABD2PCF2_9CUCU